MKKNLIVAIVLLAGVLTVSFASKSRSSCLANQPKATVGLNLGNEAPEIALNGTNGAILKLSSLRGKMVLIDFWASWCGPCRFENPSVVRAYKEFNDKKLKGGENGFTIYSVSLDVDPNAWRAAIAKDALLWPMHVSELAGWNSAIVNTYNISGIPTNYLVNDKGIIINKNLRGEDLYNALNKLLVKEK
jgi:thiol-disulfide isomerase/thioredoxin